MAHKFVKPSSAIIDFKSVTTEFFFIFTSGREETNKNEFLGNKSNFCFWTNIARTSKSDRLNQCHFYSDQSGRCYLRRVHKENDNRIRKCKSSALMLAFYIIYLLP